MLLLPTPVLGRMQAFVVFPTPRRTALVLASKHSFCVVSSRGSRLWGAAEEDADKHARERNDEERDYETRCLQASSIARFAHPARGLVEAWHTVGAVRTNVPRSASRHAHQIQSTVAEGVGTAHVASGARNRGLARLNHRRGA